MAQSLKAQVVNSSAASAASASGLLHRQCACGQHTIAGSECDECSRQRRLNGQRQSTSVSSQGSTPPSIPEAPPGHPLTGPLFHRDFSKVPVYSNVQASPIKPNPGNSVLPNQSLAPSPVASGAWLRINRPGDQYEQEADRIAEQVMRIPEPPTAQQRLSSSASLGKLQRKYTECEDEEKQLHRKETGAGPDVAPPIVHEVLNSPGQPLDAATRAFFELRFGHDFGHVRVHTNTKAAKSAQLVGARAYTVGANVAFATGQYMPGTEGGRKLLAHELSHTIQQRRSDVDSGQCFDRDDPSRNGAIYVQRQVNPAQSHRRQASLARVLYPLHYTHTVAPGEVLTGIVANEYGTQAIGTVTPLVAERNGLTPPYTIFPGDELALPPIIAPIHATHVVLPDESLSEITRDEYGDAELWPAVAQRLRLSPPFTLRAGQHLTLLQVPATGANIPNRAPAMAPPVRSANQQSIPLAPPASSASRPAPPVALPAGSSVNQPAAPVAPPAPSAGRPVLPVASPGGSAARPFASVAPSALSQSQSRSGLFTRSAPTTAGRGATEQQRAMDEWNRFSSARVHFRNFQEYLSMRPLYQNAGIDNPAEYIHQNITTITFFGQRAQGHAAHMQPVLNAAEQHLRRQGVTPQFLTQPNGFQGFNPRFTRGTRSLSNHATGHAIDINPHQNPMIRNPIIRTADPSLRAAAFVLIRAVTGVDMGNLDRDRANNNPHTRAAIEEMRRAGTLFHERFNRAWIGYQRARLQQLRRLASRNTTQIEEIRQLQLVIDAVALLQRGHGMERLLEVARGSGFISLEWELIDALRRAGMQWGGDYVQSRDFMHFELDHWI